MVVDNIVGIVIVVMGGALIGLIAYISEFGGSSSDTTRPQEPQTQQSQEGYCSNCGNEVDPTDQYCGTCGKEVGP